MRETIIVTMMILSSAVWAGKDSLRELKTYKGCGVNRECSDYGNCIGKHLNVGWTESESKAECDDTLYKFKKKENALKHSQGDQ